MTNLFVQQLLALQYNFVRGPTKPDFTPFGGPQQHNFSQFWGPWHPNFPPFGGPQELLIKNILPARPGPTRAVVGDPQIKWNLVVGDLTNEWNLVVEDLKMEFNLAVGDPKTEWNINTEKKKKMNFWDFFKSKLFLFFIFNHYPNAN